MGQTSNLLTLRSQRQNFNLWNTESKSFLYSFEFINVLQRALNKKNIFLLKVNFNFSGNVSFLQLVLFFRTSKIKNYKKLFKRVKKTKNTVKFHQILSFQSILFLQLRKLKKNCIFLDIINSNLKLSKEETKCLIYTLYNRLKRFNNTLFSRRFNLFLDFLKLTALFIESKLNSASFLFLLGQVFKQLTKKKHAIFLFFCKTLFSEIILSEFRPEKRYLIGMQFILKGKLMGKRRASSSKLLLGSVVCYCSFFMILVDLTSF